MTWCGLLYIYDPNSDGTIISFLESSVAILTGLAAIWAIVWEAPKFVRASQRRATASEKIATSTTLAAEIAIEEQEHRKGISALHRDDISNLVSALFNEISRIKTQNPEFADGVSKEQFETLTQKSWWQLKAPTRYFEFFAQIVAVFKLMHDLSDQKLNITDRQKIGFELERHRTAVRRWGEQLGINDLIGKD